MTVVARPRVRREEIESLDDVQRMLWVLAPAGGGDCRLCADIGLPVRGNYIVSVMNPDPALWSNAQAELFETGIPTPFPLDLQERFGEHRYLPLAPEFLAHPGAELVFVTVVS